LNFAAMQQKSCPTEKTGGLYKRKRKALPKFSIRGFGVRAALKYTRGRFAIRSERRDSTRRFREVTVCIAIDATQKLLTTPIFVLHAVRGGFPELHTSN
jgi:hypothetical protein